MKFTLLSDLHLEFAPLKLPDNPTSDVLLLAGDIGVAALLNTARTDKHSRRERDNILKFFNEEVTKYPKAYYIMGNHEHYHGIWEYTAEELRDRLTKNTNVTLLDKEHVRLDDGVMLWGGTLWTDFRRNDPLIMNHARNGMNDYRLIHHVPHTNSQGHTHIPKLQPDAVYAEHLSAMASLDAALLDSTDSWVVMSHHGPSWRSVDGRYGQDPLNYCYVTDLDPFVMDHPQIKVWVHGHTHTSHDYKIDETRVLCNPRGYATSGFASRGENEAFNPELTFEVPSGNEENQTSNP